MNKSVIAALVAGLAAGAGAGYWLSASSPHPATLPAKSGAAAPQEGRKVLYWYDPMRPDQRFDKPGKSPFMDMQLVPKYADEAPGGKGRGGGIAIDSRVTQNLGVRVAEARSGALTPRFAAVGTVEYNERAVVLVQTRVAGFIERLHVRAPLDPVRAGDPLVEILFPDWAAAQEEYLLLRRAGPDAEPLARAARQRLVLTGMSEEQIAAVERDGKVHARVTLRAPVSGVVAELGAREGMTVMAGATLFRIAGLGTVWIVAQVPEAQAGLLAPGSRVEARVPAYPDEVFSGRIGAILPEVSATTRTLRARIEVANPSGRLKPGMYANLAFSASGREALLVPTDAVIRTGSRNVVIVAQGDGKFRATEVEVGMETGGNAEIRKGLAAGDRVVVSGQFLIDSEASLTGALARLESAPAAASPASAVRGSGKVTGIDPAKGRVEIEHGPIPVLQWPPMTMGFPLADKGQLARLKKGDSVQFELRGQPDANGEHVIEKIAPEGK
jgi:Cu(I)/Ag(I) efflux system membrane fusion protein